MFEEAMAIGLISDLEIGLALVWYGVIIGFLLWESVVVVRKK